MPLLISIWILSKIWYKSFCSRHISESEILIIYIVGIFSYLLTIEVLNNILRPPIEAITSSMLSHNGRNNTFAHLRLLCTFQECIIIIIISTICILKTTTILNMKHLPFLDLNQHLSYLNTMIFDAKFLNVCDYGFKNAWKYDMIAKLRT